jgi:hypothetical protein
MTVAGMLNSGLFLAENASTIWPSCKPFPLSGVNGKGAFTGTRSIWASGLEGISRRFDWFCECRSWPAPCPKTQWLMHA